MEDSRFENLPAQKLYGELLGKLVNVGIVLLFVTFVVYVSGLLPPVIPMEDLPKYWVMPLNEFLEAAGSPTGWGWTQRLGAGDYLTITGIAFLASVSMVCYFVLLFAAAKAGSKIMVAIVAAELLLILLAASNILQSGGH
ncbi:MAG: DUF1634 domain-containing protein [bacterium]|nr:DUF1634 domain-containing protein [bacterium]